MKFILSAIILVQFLKLFVAVKVNLQHCNSTTSNEICYSSDEYHSNAPSHSPISVRASVDIKEIVDINEIKQTLTLLINFKVTWSDNRIQKSKPNIEPVDITDQISNLWVPELFFSNSVRIEKFKGLKADSMRQLWYFYDFYKTYSWVLVLIEPFTTEFACKMNFHDFPFDRHTCMFEVRQTSWFVEIIPMLQTSAFQDGNETLQLNSTGLPFDLKAYPMTTKAAGQIFQDNTFAPSRIQFDLTRKTDQLKTLVISFYIPSMSFTILSQVSYFIKPEVVPGRMGMLVTIFLIQTGIYGSVDAPKFRGFGMLEIWYIGMQVPILMAILEYGFLLIAIKYKGLNSEVKLGNKRTSLEQIMKIIDLFCFYCTFFCCLAFIEYYLFMCIKEMNQ